MIIMPYQTHDFTFLVELNIPDMDNLHEINNQSNHSPAETLKNLITTGLMIHRACKNPMLKKISDIIDGYDLVRTRP